MLAGFSSVAKTTYRAAPGAVAFKLAGAVITSVLPLLTTYFAALTTTKLADAYAGSQAAGGEALVFVVVTASLGIALSVWQSVQNYIDELVNYKVNAAVSDRLYRHFVCIEYWLYDDKKTVDMFDKAQNFTLFFARFFDVLARIFGSAITIVISVGALLFTDWRIGLLIIVSIIPSAIVQLKLSRLQAAHWRNNTETRRRMTGIFYNVFQPMNLAELRVYNAAKYMLELYAYYRDKDKLERIKYERQYLVRRLFADIGEAVAELTALIIVAVQIINRTQPIGQFIYVQQLVSRSLSAMHTLSSELNGIDEELVTMQDYESFMKLKPLKNGAKQLTGPPNQITFEKVNFSYPTNDVPVLHNISLTIHKGQHIAIVGENGAGKSTLIKLFMGLYQPTSGTVSIDGTALADYDEESWHSYLGVLQQDYMRYYFSTVKENITYGDVQNPYNEERYNRAIEMAEAAHFIHKLPRKDETHPSQWYEHDDGTKGVELSGGQWQRLALARNFYRDAQFIVLDEPTSAIDALAESRIFSRLFALKDKTIITVSHRLTTVKRADVIYVIQDGSIVETGTYSDLIARKGRFYTIFESQIT